MPSFLFYTSMSLLLFVAVLLILLVLIQKGRGGGLSSAFGGSGGSTAFGAKTGDVLTWATSIVFGVFILLAVILDLVVNHQYATPATKVVATTPAATDTTATPVAPAAVSGADRIAQELARMQHAASPATLPTTLPAGLAVPSIPHMAVEATTLPAVPSLAVPPLSAPATMPAVPAMPNLPPTTQPH